MTSIQDLALGYINNPNNENFKNLYLRVNNGLRAYIWNIIKTFKCSKSDLLNELTSRTYYKMIKNIHQYSPIDYQFSTWLYTIARNEALMELKKSSRFVYLEDLKNNLGTDSISKELNTSDILEEYVDFVDSVDTIEKTEKNNKIYNKYKSVLNEINNLPQIYKFILIDREINNMKYEEIAEKYQLNLNTVRSRIRLGRLLIKERIKK